MAYDKSYPEIITRDSSRWLPYQACVNCSFVDDIPTFVNRVDPANIIQQDWPVPVNGLDLGLIDGKVNIDPGAQVNDFDPDTTAIRISRGGYIDSYKTVITFTLVSSGRKEVTDLFSSPGPKSKSRKRGGGLSTPNTCNLVLMFSDANHDDRFLCYIFWNAEIQPVPEQFGGDDNQRIPATFRCYSGDDPEDPGCPRVAGTSTFLMVYINSIGQEIDPDSGLPVNIMSGYDGTFAALSMANML